jgi:hypothetical protein
MIPCFFKWTYLIDRGQTTDLRRATARVTSKDGWTMLAFVFPFALITSLNNIWA